MTSDEILKNGYQTPETPETPEKFHGEDLLKHLLSMSHRMTGMRSVVPLLSYVVDEVMALVGAERGYIVLLNDDGSFDFNVRRRADGTDIQSDVDSISHSILDEVIRTKKSVVVRNALMDPQFGGAMSVMAMQLRSIMCSPLITQSRIIGAIYVENRLKSGRFSTGDVVPLEFFSNHAAVAIENAHLNDNLETLVEERTSELMEAKEDAEAAARAKSIFLSTMTHELRTPMNGVLGMTSLLMDTRLNEDQKELVSIIQTSGDTLLTLINDILDFSKIEAQKVELAPVAFRLEKCIEQAMDLVTPAAAEKRLYLAYWIDEDVPQYLVQDITRIRQILTNLLSNAVKFTEHGQVEIHVSLSDSSSSSGVEFDTPYVAKPYEAKIQFAVTDSGIGIPEDRMSRLFLPFSQAESSTNRHYGGTGLGLVICKRLCELMGGSIEVESELGVGTTFAFSINAQVDSISGDTHNVRDELLAEKQVLLVTTNSLIERSIEQSLRSSQVEVLCAATLPTDPSVLDPISAIIIDATTFFSSSSSVQSGDLASARSENYNERQPEIYHRHAAMEQLSTVSTTFEWPFRLAATQISKPIILLTHWGDRLPSLNSQYPISTIPVPIKGTQLQSELANIIGHRIKVDSPAETRSTFDDTMSTTYPLRILLAEDNIVNQKVALRMLERYGYQVDLVENGLDAVEAVRTTHYDLIFMDVQMPKMDGVEATQKIRAEIPQKRQPYIVAMTANVAPDARASYLEANMDEHISKPIPIEQLQDALKRAALRETRGID